jgi:glutaredoxin
MLARKNPLNDIADLYTTPGCPFCAAAREDLEWRGVAYHEYDVESDPAARERMLGLTGGSRTVPVIVEPGAPPRVGWMGSGCNI